MNVKSIKQTNNNNNDNNNTHIEQQQKTASGNRRKINKRNVENGEHMNAESVSAAISYGICSQLKLSPLGETWRKALRRWFGEHCPHPHTHSKLLVASAIES